VVVGFQHELHIEFFERIIRYYGANATSVYSATAYLRKRKPRPVGDQPGLNVGYINGLTLAR
jgi:hypothetical protein